MSISSTISRIKTVNQYGALLQKFSWPDQKFLGSVSYIYLFQKLELKLCTVKPKAILVRQCHPAEWNGLHSDSQNKTNKKTKREKSTHLQSHWKWQLPPPLNCLNSQFTTLLGLANLHSKNDKFCIPSTMFIFFFFKIKQ